MGIYIWSKTYTTMNEFQWSTSTQIRHLIVKVGKSVKLKWRPITMVFHCTATNGKDATRNKRWNDPVKHFKVEVFTLCMIASKPSHLFHCSCMMMMVTLLKQFVRGKGFLGMQTHIHPEKWGSWWYNGVSSKKGLCDHFPCQTSGWLQKNIMKE